MNSIHNSLLLTISILISTSFFSQEADCLKKLEHSFNARGSYTVEDAIHKNVIIVQLSPTGNSCFNGKTRVENGTITSIFIELEDSTYSLLDKKYTNEKNSAPVIMNGISELILTEDGEKYKVVFIDKLKPKAKSYKEAVIPEDL
ncbi:MAG: hypothetical protein ACK48V_01915 [Crocinitomicaceae bacterium]